MCIFVSFLDLQFIFFYIVEKWCLTNTIDLLLLLLPPLFGRFFCCAVCFCSFIFPSVFFHTHTQLNLVVFINSNYSNAFELIHRTFALFSFNFEMSIRTFKEIHFEAAFFSSSFSFSLRLSLSLPLYLGQRQYIFSMETFYVHT